MADNIITKQVKRIKTYFYEKRLLRLEGDLKVINKRIAFDPYMTENLNEEINTPLKFSKRIEEYRIWYIGSSLLLREFYNNKASRTTLNYFWHRAPANYRMVHSGVPCLIARAMGQVVFGSGYNLNVSVYNENADKSDELSEQAKSLIMGLQDAIDFNAKVKEAAETESWSGGVFFKLSHDISVSNFPILETATIREAEVIKVRGITQAIIFKFYYTYEKRQYKLEEIYTQDANKDANIVYRLYLRDTKGEEKAVDLYSIPQTRAMFLNENEESILNDNGVVVYKGLKSMLAFYKPNRLPSHEFIDLDVGASDYEGAVDSFDALDEVYSEMVSEVRNNKTIRYTPKTMMKKYIDDAGNIVTLEADGFVTNYEVTNSNLDQDAKDKINITNIEDKQDSLKSKYMAFLSSVVNQAGLSPFALGITGLEAVNSSAESQQERNKVTLQTRAEKHETWKPFTEKLLIATLSLNYWMRSNFKDIEQPFENLDLNYNNTDIDVEFNAYTYPKPEELILTWGGAKTSGVSSTKEAVRNIHPDWDDERIDEEVNLIRYKQGMSLDTPELLQFENNEPTIKEVIENE